jgi:hypothetical protein
MAWAQPKHPAIQRLGASTAYGTVTLKSIYTSGTRLCMQPSSVFGSWGAVATDSAIHYAWHAFSTLNISELAVGAGAPKTRAKRAPKQPTGTRAAAAGGGAAANVTVTAAGKRGPRRGGGRSSTSHFRGVTQHRYTLRWEAHLWDPDGIRCKTAGSSRTKGRQVRTVGLQLWRPRNRSCTWLDLTVLTGFRACACRHMWWSRPYLPLPRWGAQLLAVSPCTLHAFCL